MAIVIEVVTRTPDEHYTSALAREEILYYNLKSIDGYKVTRPNKVRSIKALRDLCGISLKEAKDLVDGILDGTL
jgi:ribosomal protein L7/L12